MYRTYIDRYQIGSECKRGRKHLCTLKYPHAIVHNTHTRTRARAHTHAYTYTQMDMKIQFPLRTCNGYNAKPRKNWVHMVQQNMDITCMARARWVNGAHYWQKINNGSDGDNAVTHVDFSSSEHEFFEHLLHKYCHDVVAIMRDFAKDCACKWLQNKKWNFSWEHIYTNKIHCAFDYMWDASPRCQITVSTFSFDSTSITFSPAKKNCATANRRTEYLNGVNGVGDCGAVFALASNCMHVSSQSYQYTVMAPESPSPPKNGTERREENAVPT